MKILNTLTLIACLAAPAAAQTPTATAPAANVDVLGTWNATVTTAQGGAIPSEIKLKKTGEKITGTIASERGETPVEAEVKGKTLSIWFNFQGQNGPMAIELAGTVEGDTVKGSMIIAGQQAGEFVATRAKDTTAKPAEPAKDQPAAAKTDLTGAWSVSLVLEAITATPSLTLKQEGEKLTGEYVSQNYGKFPVTGTVKGNDVTFSVPMNIEGNAITAAYAGTIQPDGSLKGSVAYGDMMSGTFVASKKK